METIFAEAFHKAAVTLLSGWMIATVTAVILIATQILKTASRAVSSELAKTNMSKSAMVKNFLFNMLDWVTCTVFSFIVISRFVIAANAPATKADILWALGLVAFAAIYLWVGAMRFERRSAS